jgi:hypothetical protein
VVVVPVKLTIIFKRILYKMDDTMQKFIDRLKHEDFYMYISNEFFVSVKKNIFFLN